MRERACLTRVWGFGSCWIPGSWDLPRSYHPIVVTHSSLKPFFFNGLKKELCFSDHAWSIRPRNPIRASRKCRFVEPLIDVRIALAAPVVRTMHRFRPQGYPCPTTFAPVSTGGRCLLWTSMPLCGIVGCRGVRHGPREGWWSAHL